jgi:hypothetical protein
LSPFIGFLSSASTTIKYRFTLMCYVEVLDMEPAVFEGGIIIYEIIQVFVAFVAVFLAVKWKKSEFLAGLCFLLFYTIFEMVDVSLFTITQVVYIDIAQFGFILLSIIFFIIGMHHSWPIKAVSPQREQKNENKSSNSDSIFSILRNM